MKIVAKVQMEDGLMPVVHMFEFEIPDDIIEEYARRRLNLMTEEEAIEYVNDNPPEYDEP
jgi:hypothetical protein